MRAGRVAGALVFLALVSCSEDTGPNVSGVPGLSIVEVEVTPSNLTILVADTITEADLVQFSATAIGRTGGPVSVEGFAWRTSDPTIALIDRNGVVRPVRPGTVTIEASAHKIGKATLVILPATETIVVSPSRDTIYVDEPVVPARDTLRLKAEAYDPLGQLLAGTAFSWQSNSNTVVTVDQNGTAHAFGLGTTSVLATSNDRFAGSQISVMPVVASVTVTAPVTQALVSDTIPLTASARDYNNAAMSRKFNWTSSNQSIATVDSLGRVKVVGLGQATITARTAHRSASVNITTHERHLTVMDAGEDFTCGLAPLGRGYCWGLATNARTAADPDSSCFDVGGQGECILPPKRMNRPELSFTKISAGRDFGCGIAADQLLYCWGSDESGQMGNGGSGAGATPNVATVKSERFVDVSAGGAHACALNLVGTAYCWGNDSRGQLGDLRLMNSSTPTPVADTTLSFVAISAGDAHTCAITQSGQAYCWGAGSEGQLGNGQTGDVSVPTPVSGGNVFISISSGGNHTCGVTSASSVLCWGENAFGQLGLGVVTADVLVPTAVVGPQGYTVVSTGTTHTCGLSNGTVRCWGRSDWGQVGDNNPASHNVLSPITVAGLQAVSVTAGSSHTCAVAADGRSWCWGSNRWGALGNEYQAAIRPTPQLVARPR
jgi:alpha-tubulin suppressor-like RCC1 family protein